MNTRNSHGYGIVLEPHFDVPTLFFRDLGLQGIVVKFHFGNIIVVQAWLFLIIL